MAIDIAGVASVFRGSVFNTEVKLTAIVWVRKISAIHANEFGNRWTSFAFLGSLVAAFSIGAVRSVGIQFSAVDRTGIVV
jgi:hypothetical protein